MAVDGKELTLQMTESSTNESKKYVKLSPLESKQNLPVSPDHDKCGQSSEISTSKDEIRKYGKRSLIKFEKFRITHSYSPESFFEFLNPSGKAAVPVMEFAVNITHACTDISMKEALLVCCMLDSAHKMEIGKKDMVQVVGKRDVPIATLLDDHPVFPQWLACRDDFHNYFTEWETGTVGSSLGDLYVPEVNLLCVCVPRGFPAHSSWKRPLKWIHRSALPRMYRSNCGIVLSK